MRRLIRNLPSVWAHDFGRSLLPEVGELDIASLRSTRRFCAQVTFALLLSYAPLLAGEPQLDRLDHLGVQDGLSHSVVWDIFQDSRGFMWFATSSALNRYDGYEMVVYEHDPADEDSLASSNVMVILESGDGLLWFGTRGGGLNAFDPVHERFIRYRHDPDDPRMLSGDTVYSLFESRSGDLWVGTTTGLNLFDRKTGTSRRYVHDPADLSSLGAGSVDALIEDSTGHLWIGTDQGGVQSLSPGSDDFVHYRHDPEDVQTLSNDSVDALFLDSRGELWVGNLGAIDRLDRETGRVERFPLDPSDPRRASSVAGSFAEDADGNLWIASHGAGLSRFDRDSETFTHYYHDPDRHGSLSSNDLIALHEDRTGILWIASRSGLDKFNPRREQFEIFGPKAGRLNRLEGSRVRAITEDRDGILWVGTSDGGLTGIDRSSGTPVAFGQEMGDPTRLTNAAVTSIVEDRAGALWIGTRTGLGWLSPDRRRVSHYTHDSDDPSSIPEDYVFSLLIDAVGDLWFSGGELLGRYERDLQRFVTYRNDPTDPYSLSSEQIYGLYLDREGSIWIGTFGGLNRYDSARDRFTRYHHDPADSNSLSSNQILAFHQDSSGIYWVGTSGGGLNRWDLDGGEFRHYRRSDGLPVDSVSSILEDDRGHLWLGTSRGLCRFDRDAESFDVYTVEDGLHHSVFLFDSAFRSPAGEMFFGGVGGLTAFFPRKIREDPSPPAVVMTDFRLLNQPVPLNRKDQSSPLFESITVASDIVLNHHHKIVSLEFAGLHYASPNKNRYAYRLEGFDPDWIETDAGKRFAQYTNLDAGKYDFQVRASNPDGVWSDGRVTLRLTVLPAPWSTWWAYTLYGLALAGIVVGYVVWQRRRLDRERVINVRLREADRLKDQFLAERTAQLKERDRLLHDLTRLNYAISHDLQNPLVTIRNFTGLLRRDAEGGRSERMVRDIDRIETAAGKMQRLIEELLTLAQAGRQANSPETVPFQALVRGALSQLDERIRKTGAIIEIADDLPTVYGDRSQLVEMLENLFDNALRYVDDQVTPRVSVAVRQGAAEDGFAFQEVFTIRDNGRGIDPRYHDRIFGLFERLDPSEQDGTGLGLALVRQIIEAHGGRIWVESEGAGQGSTFCFTLGRPDEDR